MVGPPSSQVNRTLPVLRSSCARVGAARVASRRGAILRRMPFSNSAVLEISRGPPGNTPRRFFHPWAPCPSSVVVAPLVVFLFALPPGDPVDPLHWREAPLEPPPPRDRGGRAAVARPSP